MNDKTLSLIKMFIGISILLYLVYRLDITKIYRTLLGTSIIVILLMIFHYITNAFVNALALWMLVRSSEEKTGFFRIFHHYWVSSAIGRFTPARIGEFSMIGFMTKDGISLGKSTLIASIFRAISLITLIAISIFGLFVFFSREQAIRITILLVAVIIALCIPIASSKIRKLAKRFILKEKSKKFAGFSETWNKIMKEKKSELLLATAILISRVYAGAIITCWIFSEYGIDISVSSALIINAIGLIISLIPVSISGLGVKESATVYLFSMLGVDAVTTGSIYLLLAFIYFAIAAIAIWIKMYAGQANLKTREN